LPINYCISPGTVILATQEAEIGRIVDQSGLDIKQDPISKITNSKKCWCHAEVVELLPANPKP
jgi:hypothetical protein